MTEECPSHLVQKWLQNFSISMIWIVYVSPSGGWRWLWVFCKEAVSHSVFCTQLLWRVWQCRRHDECGWDPHVFLPDFKACREKEAQRHETCHTTTGYDHKASKEIDVTWHCLVGTCNIAFITFLFKLWCAGQLAQVDLSVGPSSIWLLLALAGYSSKPSTSFSREHFVLFWTSVPFADSSDDGVKLYTLAGYPVRGESVQLIFF